MPVAIAEVLALWREAERLLEELPPWSAERDVVRSEALALRDLYRRMTGAGADAQPEIDDSTETILNAQEVLRAAREGLPSPAPGWG